MAKHLKFLTLREMGLLIFKKKMKCTLSQQILSRRLSWLSFCFIYTHSPGTRPWCVKVCFHVLFQSWFNVSSLCPAGWIDVPSLGTNISESKTLM